MTEIAMTAMAPGTNAPEPKDCVWLYCVGPSGLSISSEVTGVAGETVEMVQGEGLTAVAGHVPVREFGSQALRENLEDLDWLGRCAEAHHYVITEAGRSGVVLPMRLATLYQSEHGVVDLLIERAEQLRSAIDDLTGCAEYGLKGYATMPRTASQPSSSENAPQAPTSSPGTAYLKKRRADLDAHGQAREAAAQEAERVVRELAALALATREHQLHDASLDPAAADMILNASYLVPDESSDDFAAAVADLAETVPTLRLELTGPWPPYSFATVHDPAAIPD
jgi:Gas vesicle synthesis protein GvpL/GvpF